MGKTRIGDLVSDNLISTDIGNDRVGIGSTLPLSKLDVDGDANVSGVVTANSFSGSGINLTGLVTSITAGDNISISTTTGSVTITGLANTANVVSDTIDSGSLNVTGIASASSYYGDGSTLSGLVTSITAGDNISIDSSTGSVTITGLANTANVVSDTIDTGSLNVTGLSTFSDDANFQNVSVGGTLSLSGAGSQFFAFNEDTVKVKFANWYSSNDRQYGMGQLWFETWFAAIDNNPSQSLRDERRIGFYLEKPNNGSSDSGGTNNLHPTNDRMHIDINGVFVRNNFEVTGDSTFTGGTAQGQCKFYINGSLDSTHNLGIQDSGASGVDIRIGRNSFTSTFPNIPYNGQYYGDIGVFLWYSRELSATEISSNYDSFKSRYGLT